MQLSSETLQGEGANLVYSRGKVPTVEYHTASSRREHGRIGNAEGHRTTESGTDADSDDGIRTGQPRRHGDARHQIMDSEDNLPCNRCRDEMVTASKFIISGWRRAWRSRDESRRITNSEDALPVPAA